MKKSLLIISLILPLICQSQQNYHKSILLSFYNDARLMMLGDQKNNKPLTYNAIYRLKLKNFRDSDGYIFIFPEYEHAFLNSYKYERFSAGIGYAFDNIINRFELAPSITYGWINRLVTTRSLSINLETVYKFKNFNISLMAQYTERTDLQYLYNDYLWRLSGFIGLEIKILE
ncbi:hypothetical protein [Pontimicrobium aquaticum]|uniref:DUF3575 domain-containing protein n=1 Tax=Pontimicrobium aquaticum TaxID=2565367 RepID=A0A4U0EPH8_9FLAO|nr:hypothetical protein [Pontimicrobium aquaticum]TJY33388.1 hypothetical protein E5167_12875 [Pontimicrobium aquaticum]